jgi:hypothetical protein
MFMVSESEIPEDATLQKALLPTEPKETQAIVSPITKDKQAPHKPSGEQPFENTQGGAARRALLHIVLLQATRKPCHYAIFTISATELIHDRTESLLRQIIKLNKDPNFPVLRECLLNAGMCVIMKIIANQKSRASRSAKI